MKVCPELKNCKTLCDIWSLFREHGFDPSYHSVGLLTAEIALFIGFVDDDVTKEIEEGLRKCKESDLLHSIKSK